VIVGVIGTHTPFDRLVRGLARYATDHPSEPVWVQHGKGALVPPLQGEPMVRREELLARMDAAEVVVVHAGCGTLLDAMSLGHVPVTIPRLSRFGEHVNDHQLELLRALANEDRIVAVDDIEDLPAKIALARGRRRAAPTTAATEAFFEAIRGELRGFEQTAPPARRPLTWRALRVATALLTPKHHEFR
jgi:UDP-N-acetylglucosamine transferase subunit ALG13